MNESTIDNMIRHLLDRPDESIIEDSGAGLLMHCTLKHPVQYSATFKAVKMNIFR